MSNPEEAEVWPTLREAASALFTDAERQALRENLVKEQIKQNVYLRQHPEIDHILRLALAALLRAQPDNAVRFLCDYFVSNDLEQLERQAKAAEEQMQQAKCPRRLYSIHYGSAATMYRHGRRLLMYLPGPKKTHRDIPPIYSNYRQHFCINLGFIAVGVLLLLYTVAQKIQQRLHTRSDDSAGAVTDRSTSALRVVIIGGGTGGAALAAALTHACPEHRITVIEESRTQTFWGMLPLAFVGHRSYDLGTVGGPNYLRAPSAWNVTRDAALVKGNVLHVRPVEQEVIVKVEHNVKAQAERDRLKHTAQGVLQGEEHATHVFPTTHSVQVGEGKRATRWRALCGRGGWQADVHGRLSQPIHEQRESDAQEDHTSDVKTSEGGRVLPGGLVAYPYDVLIVASGARRTLGSLTPFVQPEQLDRYSLTISPGPTRDTLANVFQGNVLYLKLPPRSFVRQMERARQGAAWPPAQRIVLSEQSHERGGDAALAALAHPLRTNAELLTPTQEGSEDVQSSSPPPTAATAVSEVEAVWRVASRLMCYSTRQFDGTFLSTVNTIWKYLQYRNKFGLCRLYAITADAAPMGDGPDALNDAMLRFWHARQTFTRADGARDARFQLLSHTYPLALDQRARRVTLYNYAHNVELVVPYALLILDLPLRAPYFVRASGLHRLHYTCPNNTTNGDDVACSDGVQSREDGVAGALQKYLQESRTACSRGGQPPLLQRGDAEDYEDEAGFMDVDPQTLQHRRYGNIFALGDVAGLPTSKSYGATLAQVPVVLHNVLQVLHNIECATQGATRTSAQDAVAADALVPHAVNARYDGYSSFHVVMTTWRAMWPEMHYNAAQQEAFNTSGSAAANACAIDQLTSTPLTPCCHHMWDNLSWRGLRGLCNGMFCQLTLYELAYFFLFNRAMWYPPGWFTFPVFPEVKRDAAAAAS